MAHYVLIDHENVVTQGFVGRDENDPLPEGVESWEQYYCPPEAKACLRTSYNTRAGVHLKEDGTPSEDQSKAFRKNYAGVGFKYDEARDAFVPPQPFPSWLLDEQTCLWKAPVEHPADDKLYSWSEEDLAWVAAPEQPEPPAPPAE